MDYIELESERLLFRKYSVEDYRVFYDMLLSGTLNAA